MSEFFRQIIWIHITVAGNKQAASVFFGKSEKTAPLIFYPDGSEIFRICSHHKHDLCTGKGGIYIRLILLTYLVFKRNCRIKRLYPCLFKLKIDIVGYNAVGSSAA